MSRTSQAEVKQIFVLLCKSMGKEIGHKPGNWYLDYAPGYGGYIIIEANGGTLYPLARFRMPAREFYRAVSFALDALDVQKREAAE